VDFEAHFFKVGLKEFIADHMAVESSESIIYCSFIIVHDLFFPAKLLMEGGRE
jgi:hypothetical protein